MTTISFTTAFDAIILNFFDGVEISGTFIGFTGSVVGYDGDNP